jgi:hypothetical protein
MTKKDGSWGYASHNVDDDNDEKLTYTRYEESGKVNRYTDNGDGGHSHESWKDKDDYNKGNDADYSRQESNDSKNPSTGDIQKDTGCYLTTACINHFQENFDDNCYELKVLRWFRDNFVSKSDIRHYYEVAPTIVEAIEESPNKKNIYAYIYKNIIEFCIESIKKENFDVAYDRYKNSVLTFEETYAKPLIGKKLIRSIKGIIK